MKMRFCANLKSFIDIPEEFLVAFYVSREDSRFGQIAKVGNSWFDEGTRTKYVHLICPDATIYATPLFSPIPYKPITTIHPPPNFYLRKPGQKYTEEIMNNLGRTFSHFYKIIKQEQFNLNKIISDYRNLFGEDLEQIRATSEISTFSTF